MLLRLYDEEHRQAQSILEDNLKPIQLATCDLEGNSLDTFTLHGWRSFLRICLPTDAGTANIPDVRLPQIGIRRIASDNRTCSRQSEPLAAQPSLPNRWRFIARNQSTPGLRLLPHYLL